MASNDDLITGLMIKFARREKLTDEEMRILEEWWQQSPEHQQLAEQFGDADWVKAELAKMKPAPMAEMWEGINRYLDEIGAPDDRDADTPMQWEKQAIPSIPRWVKVAAVAATLMVCVSTVWLLGIRGRGRTAGPAPAGAVAEKPSQVAPADGVLLVGSDGSEVDLNTVRMGDTVGRMGNLYAKKLDTNQVAIYRVDENGGAEGWQAVLVGKRRSPFFVRLADGSRVVMNGGARLEYPVAGRAAADNYSMEGEAFFEVTKDKSRPFIVHTPLGRSIEVLGTSFNVEAEKDAQSSRVVLLNGALRVRNGAEDTVLHGAQEAVLSAGKTDVHPIRDPAAVIAWVKRSLYFHFSNIEFTDAIAAVASWYGYTVSNPKGLRGIPVTDNLRKDLSPDGVVSKLGEIETGYLCVWVSDKTIYISDKRTAINR